MSNGKVKKVSPQDLQLVQNLIERCIQLYMKPNEVVDMLQHQAKIEPGFTKLVWQKLEEENQEFFRSYYIRLTLIDQIQKFNKLLETQAEWMRQESSYTGPASVSKPKGSLVPLYNSQAMNLENIPLSAVANLPNALTYVGSSHHPCMQSGVGMPGLSRGHDIAPNQQMNQNPAYNVLARQPVLPEVHVPSFVGEESNPKPVNEPTVESDSSLFGFLGQSPRNFSLSDLTADVSISSDILDNYSGSPYLAADIEFLNLQDDGYIKDRHSNRLDRTCGK